MSGGIATSVPGRRYSGPVDAALHEQWRRGRREVVRRHHPDVGGDAEVLLARLVEHDHRYRRLEELEHASRPSRVPEPILTAWSGARDVLARGARTARAALPLRRLRRRRYFDI